MRPYGRQAHRGRHIHWVNPWFSWGRILTTLARAGADRRRAWALYDCDGALPGHCSLGTGEGWCSTSPARVSPDAAGTASWESYSGKRNTGSENTESQRNRDLALSSPKGGRGLQTCVDNLGRAMEGFGQPRPPHLRPAVRYIGSRTAATPGGGGPSAKWRAQFRDERALTSGSHVLSITCLASCWSR